MDSTTQSQGLRKKLPSITHVLETCLSVRSMADSAKFYKAVLGLEPFLGAASVCQAFFFVTFNSQWLKCQKQRITGFALGQTTLLLVQIGETSEDSAVEGRGVIPGHGPSQNIIDSLQARGPSGIPQSSLKQHFCLAVKSPDDVSIWESRFKECNVQILGTMNWEQVGDRYTLLTLTVTLARLAAGVHGITTDNELISQLLSIMIRINHESRRFLTGILTMRVYS